MEPLAHKLRPTKLADVYGQDHLVSKEGIITKMIENNSFFNIILHGNPGVGKTSIALIIAEESKMDYYHFNASVDNKQKLKDIINTTAYHNILLIVDEIQRMNVDIQDVLLPFIENGKVKLIGITTENPYATVNKAIRSRCQIYQFNDLNSDDIKEALKGAINSSNLTYDGLILPTVIDYISKRCNNELRTAYNMLEAIVIYGNKLDQINLVIAKKALGDKNLALDKSQDDYYDILSAFQKSLRGSDVNASLHYLARLITLGDLDSIIRRLLAIAYEDVGLADPNMGIKVKHACDAAKTLGFPEARIPLSVAVIDIALAAKSNSALEALDQAISDYKEGKTGPIPKHILNREIARDPSIYKFPHNEPSGFVKQQYLPDNLVNTIYYTPKTNSNYEVLLEKRLEYIKKLYDK